MQGTIWDSRILLMAVELLEIDMIAQLAVHYNNIYKACPNLMSGNSVVSTGTQHQTEKATQKSATCRVLKSRR